MPLESFQPAKGLEKRLLGKVLRVCPVPDESPRHPVHPVLVSPHQLVEQTCLAVAYAANDLTISHGLGLPLFGRPRHGGFFNSAAAI